MQVRAESSGGEFGEGSSSVCLLPIPLTEFHHLPLPSVLTTTHRRWDMTNGIRALPVGPDFAA